MLLLGWASLFAGIALAFYGVPHFYAPFSAGLAVILHYVYTRYSGTGLFTGWSRWRVVCFLFGLLAFSIISDQIGIALGYWHYPAYNSLPDYALQYTFEFTVALLYIMLAFMIGLEFYRKRGLGYTASFIVSLMTFSVLTGLGTEFFNFYAESWIVTDMPFSNMRLGRFWLVFITLGYWILSLAPYLLYRIFDAYVPLQASKT